MIGCCAGVPLAGVPAPLGDGGQVGDAAGAALEVLGGAARHHPQQLLVVGPAAARRGVVRQAAGHALGPALELCVCNLTGGRLELLLGKTWNPGLHWETPGTQSSYWETPGSQGPY